MLRKAAADDKQLVYRLRTEAVMFRNVACFVKYCVTMENVLVNVSRFLVK